MKNGYFNLLFAAVFTAVPAATVFADIETGGSMFAGSETSDLANAFNLASTSGQETSTGCTTNPMTNNQQVITELPPLPENIIQPVSFSEPYTASSGSPSTPPSDDPRRPPYYPPNPPSPPATPEPGTWLIVGIGAVAMVPLLRRKRNFRKNEAAELNV